MKFAMWKLVPVGTTNGAAIKPDPSEHFAAVLNKHGLLRFPNPAPLDYHGRSLAGFDQTEIALLEPKPKKTRQLPEES